MQVDIVVELVSVTTKVMVLSVLAPAVVGLTRFALFQSSMKVGLVYSVEPIVHGPAPVSCDACTLLTNHV